MSFLEDFAVGMAEQKLKMLEDVGAELIISTDLSCLLHLDGLIKKQNKNMRVMHLDYTKLTKLI